MTVVDPQTLQFNLSRPWAGFPYILSIDAGMVASPTAIKAAGSGFSSNPGQAGAGPFVLTSYRPGESIVFERNEGYYGGEVPSTGSPSCDPGGQEAAYAALKAGEFDAATSDLRSPSPMRRTTD